jgi:hypothetical protein
MAESESNIRSPRSPRATGPMPFVAISPERFLRAARGAASLLHITNGSIAADGIRRSGVAGKVTPSADILHEGPTPSGLPPERWRKVRARYLAEHGYCGYEECLADLTEWDHAVDEYRSYDEVVLWFEHDLFDQLELIRVLDLIARGPAAPRASLICVDRFPGFERFIGLGQLDAGQLASLYPARRPVTREQIALASAAWEAFRAPDPRGLVDLARRTETDATLPFLGDALLRFLADYPSVENGLTHTETLSLDALTGGPLEAGALFMRTQAREARPFMGDMPFFDIMRTLARARVPLVAISEPPAAWDLRGHTIELLDAGRDVLSGRVDRIALNGLDAWRGGVHLNGTAPVWRWDAGRKTLVK